MVLYEDITVLNQCAPLGECEDFQIDQCHSHFKQKYRLKMFCQNMPFLALQVAGELWQSSVVWSEKSDMLLGFL